MEILFLLALPLLAFAFGGGDGGDDTPDKPNGEAINGTEGDDTLVGGVGDDSIYGGAGGDDLFGGAGDDLLSGSFGRDLIEAGPGDDSVRGGAGGDLLLGNTGDDTMDGGRDDDIVMGDAGNDLVHLGTGNDQGWVDDEISPEAFATGQLGDDTIFGDAGNDSIWDYSGTNQLYGGDGDDSISGTDNQLDGWDTAPHAADQLFGDAGNDLLIGDDGDTLTGGDGVDRFQILSQNADDQVVEITDFIGGIDRLVLQPLAGNMDPNDWTLVTNTNDQTGEVLVGLANNADSSQVINYISLKNPVNFGIWLVDLQM